MLNRILIFLILTNMASAADMQFSIMPQKIIGPISSYIYGLNDQDASDTGATVRRLGVTDGPAIIGSPTLRTQVLITKIPVMIGFVNIYIRLIVLNPQEDGY